MRTNQLWTNRMEDILTKWYWSGFTKAQIAHQFKEQYGIEITRNSVIGKIDRMRRRGLLK